MESCRFGAEVSKFLVGGFTRAIAYAAYAAAARVSSQWSSRSVIGHDLPKISIEERSSPKHGRACGLGDFDPRPIPEGVREPICIRKK